MDYVIHLFTGLDYSYKNDPAMWTIPTAQHSLIVSILSAGTFFGAVFSGDVADWIGRRTTIMWSCILFCAGVVMQCVSENFRLLSAGRAIAGLGVGAVSCTM
jgi:MFS family permease